MAMQKLQNIKNILQFVDIQQFYSAWVSKN